MDLVNIIMDFIKTIFSWPIITLILVMIFLLKYHESISDFIKNIKTAKGPGFEIIRKQENKGKNKLTVEKSEADKLTYELTQSIVDNVEKDKLIDEAKIIIPQLASGMQFYKFEYLDLFFVPITKNVLDWFNTIIKSTKEAYKLSWLSIIKNEEQTETILSVLLAQNMLEDLGSSINITDEGRNFLIHLKSKYNGKLLNKIVR